MPAGPNRFGSHVAISGPVELRASEKKEYQRSDAKCLRGRNSQFAGECGTDLWIESVCKNWQIRWQMHFKFVCEKRIHSWAIGKRENGRPRNFAEKAPKGG